jgi:hypothetical protein
MWLGFEHFVIAILEACLIKTCEVVIQFFGKDLKTTSV